MLLNSCCFMRYWSYTGFKQQNDLQGHLRALAMVLFDRPHTIFISHPLQLCLYLAPFPRYYHLFPKI